MDSIYPDAKQMGREDARAMIIKTKPKTLNSLVNIKRVLGTQVNGKYSDHAKGCRIAYRHGVEEELRKYLEKLRAQHPESPYL